MPRPESEDLTAAARHLDQAIRDLQRVPAASTALLHALKARQALIELALSGLSTSAYRPTGDPS